MARQRSDVKWDKLDNTAHLFPVIAGEGMSNVYRVAVVLKEEIQADLLQEALDLVLPHFDAFRVRLRRGIFWYYFEDNKKPLPKVRQEMNYPNQLISPSLNQSYLFRVSYYQCRINLEVFHVLSDGMGGINLLRELTYQYLRLSHPKLREKLSDALSSETSLNKEDSYVRNFKKAKGKAYKTKRAYLINGEKLPLGELGVMHGYMPVDQLKTVCKSHKVSINEYLVAVFYWSVYLECLHGQASKRPISVAVPVNLRPYYKSITTKNFFVMVSAIIDPVEENFSFEDILNITKESLRSQINPENLDRILSYNVANAKKFIVRAIPLSLKNLALKWVYRSSALANSTTITNVGNIGVKEEYRPYIEEFHAILSMSKGQNIKGTVVSYQGKLAFTFSSNLASVYVQRGFFQKIAQDGIDVKIRTNGVYDG